MKEESIVIRFEDGTITECSNAIIIPEKAMVEAGYIKTLTTNSTAHSKHEFQAITNMALFKFQENELGLKTFNGPFTIQCKNEIETVTAGVLVLLDSQGDLHIIGSPGQNVNKLLQLAHRFCTRWVRLDI